MKQSLLLVLSGCLFTGFVWATVVTAVFLAPSTGYFAIPGGGTMPHGIPTDSAVHAFFTAFYQASLLQAIVIGFGFGLALICSGRTRTRVRTR